MAEGRDGYVEELAKLHMREEAAVRTRNKLVEEKASNPPCRAVKRPVGILACEGHRKVDPRETRRGEAHPPE